MAEKIAPPVIMNSNPLKSLGDLQHALADAAMLGYRDNSNPAEGGRPRRTGRSVAEQILVPNSWTKKFERSLKVAYLTGYEFRFVVEGVRPPRKGQGRKKK